MQFSGKNCQVVGWCSPPPPLGVGTSTWELLDLPLSRMINKSGRNKEQWSVWLMRFKLQVMLYNSLVIARQNVSITCVSFLISDRVHEKILMSIFRLYWLKGNDMVFLVLLKLRHLHDCRNWCNCPCTIYVPAMLSISYWYSSQVEKSTITGNLQGTFGVIDIMLKGTM